MMIYHLHRSRTKGAIPLGVKIGGLGVLVLAGIIYALLTYKSYTKGLPPPQQDSVQRSAPESRRPPRPRDFKRMREEIVKELNLTKEQREKKKEIWSNGPPASPEEMRERIQKSREILTPEQREIARKTFRQRFQRRLRRQLERARKALPPDQFKIFQDRLKDRINRWRTRRPGRQQPQQQKNNVP